ncbi:peptidylprolyl isomerase [Bizionia paragorgiae]|jgi:parvulin-like peptidyl-prolyl isomerase|uniref:peptidylprolyl isomerase n=1 Tax=Bizionia paragorgiae TaxID=283786 RepID=UPI00299EA495|nr:peptidylprolyl isomerase [Bizionia paragorgiae]MDX1271971.1 peptidylprolyl isomerase [Bizionia paragorgiae]
MKHTLLLLFILSTLSISAQDAVKDIENISNLEDAELYIEKSASKRNKLIAFNEEKHKSTLAQSLLAMPVGMTKTVPSQFKKTHYKVIDKSKDPHYRISYIYFDESKVDINDIYEMRKTILYKYENGVPFEDLAKRYSMDDNALRGGDSGWFKDNEMPIEIENEAANLAHSVGDIYTVSVEKDRGYYIILKTHRVTTIKEVYVLKIEEKL